MNPETLDYQTKVVAPSQQLYQQLSMQAHDLYLQAKSSALQLHSDIAKSTLEFYQHPTETATRWQLQAIESGNKLYATFNNEIIPSVHADYQQLAINVANYAIQSRKSFQSFLDNPEKVTVETFTAFNQALIAFLDKTIDVSAEVLKEISATATEIINLLITQPVESMESFYYQTLTTLLNGYFNLISSFLVMT